MKGRWNFGHSEQTELRLFTLDETALFLNKFQSFWKGFDVANRKARKKNAEYATPTNLK